MKRRRLLRAGVILAGIGWGAWLWLHFHGAQGGLRRPAGTEAAMRPVSAPLPPGIPAEEVVQRTPPSLLAFADGLNAPGRSVKDDIRLVIAVLAMYRSVCHTTNPVGENAEITAALLGRNRLHYAFIRPGNPAVNARGELCDRWGTPYFFHQISGTEMQIRSAGPDRRQWTADDIVGSP